jgi:hypothetical protein
MDPVPVPLTGTDTPANGASWDITLNRVVIASSASPSGWTVGTVVINNTLAVSAPDTAWIGKGYEVRYAGGQTGGPQTKVHPEAGGSANPASGPFSCQRRRYNPQIAA